MPTFLNKILPAIFALFLVCVLASTAWSRALTGAAELSYLNYSAKNDVGKLSDAAQWTQSYSVLYTKSGLFRNGRLGFYDVKLGYEWSLLDVDLTLGTSKGSINEDTNKLLYSGELLFAPGGLPFKLYAFSYDLAHADFRQGSLLGRRGADPLKLSSGVIIDPGVFVGIDNGTHVSSGFTFEAGIKNGSYRGQYRDVLSRFPKLLISYSDDYVLDKERLEPVDYRLRDLAFISLNKKDNWFHYKVTSFTDNIDSSNDYSITQFILGTIDHTQKRQWINLTNWIRLSVDANYIVTDDNHDLRGQAEEFDLNLFTLLRRDGFVSSSYVNFNRFSQGDRISRALSLPFWVTYERTRNQRWRGILQYDAEATEDTETGDQWESKDYYTRLQLETFLSDRRWVLTPSAALESVEATRGNGQGAEITLSLATNARLRQKASWFGRYSAKVNEGSLDASDSDVNWLEQEFDGSVTKQFTPRLSAGLHANVVLRNGDLYGNAVYHITGNSQLSQFITDQVIQLESGGSQDGTGAYASVGATADHFSTGRLKNRASVYLEYWNVETASKYELTAEHRLDYNSRSITASMVNRLVHGDGLGRSTVSSQLSQGAGVVAAEQLEYKFEHTSSLHYEPNRAFKNKSFFSLFLTDIAERSFRVSNVAAYSFYKVNGLVRKVSDFSAEVAYENYTGGNVESVFSLLTQARYYPIYNVTLGASVRYQYASPANRAEITYGLMASRTFPKFAISLRYELGFRDAEQGDPNGTLEEQRWSVNVSKKL